MIDYKSIRDIDDNNNEGKLLISAISILTTIQHSQIRDNTFGGLSHPDDILKSLLDNANRIYYSDEYKLYLDSVDRDNKISKIIL